MRVRVEGGWVRVEMSGRVRTRVWLRIVGIAISGHGRENICVHV